MHNSLLSFIERLPITGVKTADEFYGIKEGWCLGHNTDIWAMTNPVGEGSGEPMWANWNMGGAWISTHLWDHYAFSMSKSYLSQVYATLKGAADFCMNWLVQLPNTNYLITAPSTSPENRYKTPAGFVGATLYGGFADIAMIRECLTNTRDAAVILGEDHDYIEKINNVLKNLLPYRVGKNGNLQEWFNDWNDEDPQHRHQSHLFGLYPGHQITTTRTPDLAAACKRTLEIKGDKSTGWSTGWRVNLQARLREAENAYHFYRVLLNYVSPDGYQGQDRRSGTHRGSCVGFLGDKRNDEVLQKQWSSDKAVRRHLVPPTILIFSNDDKVVPPVTNAVAYYSALRDAGADCSMLCYPTGGHGWGFRSNFKYHEMMLMELTQWLNEQKMPTDSSVKVACVGNSITDGHGIAVSDLFGYPARLANNLGQNYAVKNFGVSGRTLSNSGDFPYQKEE